VALERPAQRGVEAPRAIAFRRAHELVLEAEAVQERLETPVHVVAVTLGRTVRIGNGGQRLVKMLGDPLPVGDVVGHGAQPVHVVGEGVKPRGPPRQAVEGLADQGGAKDLGEGADVRQA
jgi:hypothetical protein